MAPAKLKIVITALSVAQANAIAAQKASFHLMIQPAQNVKFQTVPNVLAHRHAPNANLISDWRTENALNVIKARVIFAIRIMDGATGVNQDTS